MNVRLLSLLLAAALLLGACDKDANIDRSPSAPLATAERLALADVVRMAQSATKNNQPLDEICPKVNPNAELVDDLTVGLLLLPDVGSIDDGTFNQAAFEGMEAAGRCFGVATTFLESAGGDSASQIQSLLDRQVDIIIGVGFQFQEAIVSAATARPDVRFIGVDQLNPDRLANFVAISFRDDQVGFLAGATAALLSDSGTVAVIAGPTSVPPVVAIADGFEAGARHISPESTVLRHHFDSFNDPQAGAAQATAFIAEGADVVFGAAGATGSGSTRSAAASGALVIGVDQDEYYTTFAGGSEVGANRLVTSAIKRVDLGVFLTIAAMSQSGIEGGDFVLDAANGGVTYAPFHEAEVPDEVAARLNDLRLGLASGDIDPTAGG